MASIREPSRYVSPAAAELQSYPLLTPLPLSPPLAPQKPTPSAKTGIMAFTTKHLKCLACKTPITNAEATLCKHCLPREAEIYRRQLAAVNELEEKFGRLWTQCQRCQGSLHQDVLCSSRDW